MPSYMDRQHPLRVHFAGNLHAKRPEPICGRNNAVRFTTFEPEVTCNVCLMWLGLYVPLSHLREHQRAQIMHHEHHSEHIVYQAAVAPCDRPRDISLTEDWAL